jgi:hypothetical protein
MGGEGSTRVTVKHLIKLVKPKIKAMDGFRSTENTAPSLTPR